MHLYTLVSGSGFQVYPHVVVLLETPVGPPFKNVYKDLLQYEDFSQLRNIGAISNPMITSVQLLGQIRCDKDVHITFC